MPSIDMSDVFLNFYVWDKPVTKVKVNPDGELVFITHEYEKGQKDEWGRYKGKWIDIEHSIEEVCIRTKPVEED